MDMARHITEPLGHDVDTARAVFAGQYLHGQCVALAIAIHRRTGWPLVASRGRRRELLHAGVRTPSGLCMDIRGEVGERDFMALHGADHVTPADEATLLEEDPKIGEGAIRQADERLALLFPGLPGPDARLTRIEAFANDLEEVCRRHGIWLRDDGPHGIIAYDGYGDEAGFRISLGTFGEARIHRMLEGQDGMRPHPMGREED
jgi:hypothetical protein